MQNIKVILLNVDSFNNINFYNIKLDSLSYLSKVCLLVKA